MSFALIGYRGSGKSTVARLLADRWGWRAVDADDEIERRAGQSIAEIFASSGEGSFRDLECAVLRDLVPRPSIVLAAGGGAVLREENRGLLKQCEYVVWLTASAATLYDRIGADATTAARRPPLSDRGGLAEVETLLAEREPLYREVADAVVDTEGRRSQDVAELIAARWQPAPSARPSER